jgi:hypothetical protein
VTAAALVAVYVAQETLEGMLATGHPTGFAGVFGHGGWWALPAALAVGLAIALALRTADAIVARVHRAGTSARARVRARTPPSYDCAFSRAAPLALAAAGRAPPAG